ncbi:MAG: hypothetical protein L0191_10725 [Acidobacteria bacterium]|nr:hypothetical protein [Acidobacteriota bacterium]
MKLPFLQVLCAAALSCAVGIAFANPDKDESGKGRGWYSFEKDWKEKKHWKEGEYDKDWDDDGLGSYFHEHGYTQLDIPPGHYPPPGECRIWYPDRPPGHQPPPGNCHQFRTQVPLGALLIRHPDNDLGEPQVVNRQVTDPEAEDPEEKLERMYEEQLERSVR